MTNALVILGLVCGGLVGAIVQTTRDWRHPQRMRREAEKRSWG